MIRERSVYRTYIMVSSCRGSWLFCQLHALPRSLCFHLTLGWLHSLASKAFHSRTGSLYALDGMQHHRSRLRTSTQMTGPESQDSPSSVTLGIRERRAHRCSAGTAVHSSLVWTVFRLQDYKVMLNCHNVLRTRRVRLCISRAAR